MSQGIELLADPTRRRIVALIAGAVRHPADIAETIGLSRPAVSHHLRLLVQAGIVRWSTSAFDRRSRTYVLDASARDAVIAWLAGVDLRGVRPTFRARFQPRPRVHRLRGVGADIGMDVDGFDSFEPS